MESQDHTAGLNCCTFRKDTISLEGGQRCVVLHCPICLETILHVRGAVLDSEITEMLPHNASPHKDIHLLDAPR